jgi:hypothetical protein
VSERAKSVSEQVRERASARRPHDNRTVVLDVHVQDLFAANPVGPLDGHAAVETPRPQQRGIQDVWTIRGLANERSA